MLTETEVLALRRLLDEKALLDLNARFAHAVDRRDIALLRTVYHPDAPEDHGAAYTGTAEGFIDRIAAGRRGGALSNHHIGNAVFHIDGDLAEGEVYFIACTVFDKRGVHWLVAGRYLDHYERRDGEWRIAKRVVVRDWVLQAPTPEDYPAFLASLGQPPAIDRADPVYQNLAAFTGRLQA